MPRVPRAETFEAGEVFLCIASSDVFVELFWLGKISTPDAIIRIGESGFADGWRFFRLSSESICLSIRSCPTIWRIKWVSDGLNFGQ
jgi:hypothetical protein